MNVEDTVKIIDQIKPRLVILNHFGIKLHREDKTEIGRDIQKQTDCQVMIAKDGLGFDLA